MKETAAILILLLIAISVPWVFYFVLKYNLFILIPIWINLATILSVFIICIHEQVKDEIR